MAYIPPRERTFTLRLADEYEHHTYLYLQLFKHLLERLGREGALAVWEIVLQDRDDKLLVEILNAEWETTPGEQALGPDDPTAEALSELFPTPVEGVTPDEAREIIECTPPFRQIHQALPGLHVQQAMTTYDALHLFQDGMATIVETLIDRYGKAGELIAYDALLETWSENRNVNVADFMTSRAKRFSTPPDEPNIFSAGLEVAFIRGSDTEVVTRVTECEWARYYRERHPRVGYLLACSLDNAAYRSFNDQIRLQRTSTLMEGGTACDFRVYAVLDSPASSD